MEKKSFLRFLLTIAAVLLSLTGCLDEHFNEGDIPDPNPTPNPGGDKVTLITGSLDISHEWKYANTLVSDVVTSSAILEHDNGKEITEEQINQLLPFEIKWTQPEEMTRGTKVFTLQEKNFGEKTLSAQENNDNIVLKTYAQTFSFVFDGMAFAFKTSYQTATSQYEGINLANCVLDSIVYVDQKAETIERYYVDERPFIRSKVTFTFDVCRHHTHDGSKHTDQLYPYIIVSAPEKVDPEEDIFNGAVIIAGTEKLFFNRKVDANTNIYTSQVDVWEFWTVSGKKRTTYSTELEIKQWIDDAKEPWIVPSMEFGYPQFGEERFSTSGDYAKENITDYVFQKTTSDWKALWKYADNYNISVHGSSEKAWKTYLGAKVVEMPSALHEFYYDKYTYDGYTEKSANGTTYLAYPSMIYFNSLYNGDTYKLSQNQEFWVEKGNVNPPAPKDSIKSEKILYELNKNGETWISKIIFRRIYSQSGQRDSIATQVLKRATKVDDNQRFIRDNNILSLKAQPDPVKISEDTETDKTTGHVVTTIVNRHSFDFEFFTFNFEETYQTAYTMYKGERLDFLAPTPTVGYSNKEPKDMGQIVDTDGKKYNRTEYTVSFKETYGDFTTMYYPVFDIDVLDNSKPETDDIISWTFDRERNGMISRIIVHVTYKLSGTRDTIFTADLAQKRVDPKPQEFFCTDNTLRLDDATPIVTTQTHPTDSVTYEITTTTNRFKYDISNIDGNEYYDVVTTTDVTAYIYFQGTKIDFLAPERSQISYSGSTPADKGQVTQNGQKYDLTTYTHTYKELYDGKTEIFTNTVDLYVKQQEATRVEWRDFDHGLERVSDTQWKSFFTLYEKFSDGTEKNNYKEVLYNIYVQAPDKRTLQLNSAEFDYTSLTPKSVSSSTRSGGQNITVTTLKTPYDLVYTSKANEAVSSEFVFVSETAVYKDGDITVNFKSADWANIQNEGYSAPLQGLVGEYNRYNAAFNISGQYNGVTYPASALVDVDVLAPLDPTIPPEWGEIDIDKTTKYGRISISWEKTADGKFKPFYSGTFFTYKGIISFKKDYKQFTEMDTNLITKEVGNAWNSTKLFPSYITVDKSAANLAWAYYDVITGTLLTDVHSSKMEVEGGFDMEQPFVANGGQADVYKITQKGERTLVIVTFNGQELFREVF